MLELSLLGLGGGGGKKVALVLFEQLIELSRDGLARLLGGSRFQDSGGGEKINGRGVGAGRGREEKFV